MTSESCPKCNGRIIEEDGDLFCAKCFWTIKQAKTRKPVAEEFRGETVKPCRQCGQDFTAKWRQEFCPECLKERKREACRKFRKKAKGEAKMIYSNYE